MINQKVENTQGYICSTAGLTVSSSLDSRRNCNSSFEPFRDKIPVSEIIEYYGIEMVIPRPYLFGTQPANEYISSKRRFVKDRLRNCGLECLQRTPPFVVALFDLTSTTLAITDGHNRIRYSALFGIDAVPSLVLSVEEFADIMNKAEPGKNYNPDSAREMLEKDISNTLVSFGSLPREKQPICLSGVSNMKELEGRFSLSSIKSFSI